MPTDTHTVRPRRTVVRAALVVAAAAAALTAPHLATAGGYGWPLKPFLQQHPVRGFFGDPRVGHGPHGISRQFHFGVDVSAPDGTLVYATASGRISTVPRHPDAVVVTRADGVQFSYWHLDTLVRVGAYAVAYRTPIGRIARGWGHVHFSEWRGGRYVNPLRPGAMEPYADQTRPAVGGITLEHDGVPMGRRDLRGNFDLVAEVADETPLAVLAPWDAKPVVPALVRWRIVGARHASPWRTAVDFRQSIPSANAFASVYARWTRQNHAGRNGRYRVVLAHDWRTTTLPRGTYRLEVVALDNRGNRGAASLAFSVAG